MAMFWGLDEGKIMEEARQIAERKWQKANPALNKKYMYVF